MKKIKILEVLDCYYPKFDGPTQVVTNYAKNLIKMDDVEVEVLVPRYKGYKDNQQFNVIRAKSMKGPEGYMTGLPALDCKMKKYLKQGNFDIIHFHSPFTMGRFAAKFGKKNKIPTVFTFHTKYKEDIYRTVKSKFARNFAMKYIMKSINMADKVLTVSNDSINYLRDYGYKKQVDVIRNGTDLLFPENSSDLINKVNEMYNLQKEKNVFLSVGRIVENKRLDFSLEVLKIVKDKGYKFKFLIVGAGPYEETLKKHCSELGLDDMVIFTGKIMDRQLLSGHYLRSDLFMFPSTFDTASLAPIEAAAMKLPTIMTLGCSTSEIIENERNGLLVESNSEQWADKIIEFISNKNKMKELKENCFKEVYRSWESVSKEILETYKQIIKEYKGL